MQQYAHWNPHERHTETDCACENVDDYDHVSCSEEERGEREAFSQPTITASPNPTPASQEHTQIKKSTLLLYY